MTTRRSLKIVLLVVCLVGLPIVAFWLGWVLRAEFIRGMDLRHQCRFDQIEFMLLMYHADHGVFPPTKYQSTPDGPKHSWRVLLVPYTNWDYIDRFPKYDFSQEWNSKGNLQALEKMHRFMYFRRASDDGEISHYLAIGDDEEWPGEGRQPLRSRLIKKGKDGFLIVEYPDSTTHWMKPEY